MSSVPLDVFEEIAEDRARSGPPGPAPGPFRPAPHEPGVPPSPTPASPPVAEAAGTPFEGVRAVAFDLDGTLVDFLTMKHASCDAAARAMVAAGLPLRVREASRRLLELAMDQGIELDSIPEMLLIDVLGYVDRRIQKAGEAAWRDAEAAVTAYPGARATLAILRRRGYRLALVTDAPGPKAMERLRRTDLLEYFDHVLTRHDHPGGKADASPFIDLLGRWELHPEEVAMVGDNPRRDVRGARELGCATVLARYGLQDGFASDRLRDRAHAEVDGIGELLDLLVMKGNT